MLHTTPRKGRKRLLALLAAAAVLSCGTAGGVVVPGTSHHRRAGRPRRPDNPHIGHFRPEGRF